MKYPKSIQLTELEQAELSILVSRARSTMSFWLLAYRTRGIDLHSRLPMASPAPLPGEFCLSWHSRALGQKAIALGAQYRKFQAEKLLANATYTPSGNGRH